MHHSAISTPAPRTGSDSRERPESGRSGISIHAPRTGSDLPGRFPSAAAAYFNPRSPHGERQPEAEEDAPEAEISIHAPRTGSDKAVLAPDAPVKISIHAPRTGSDVAAVHVHQHPAHFNPRSPHGERQTQRFCTLRCCEFQSTLPARGATKPRRCARTDERNFNPRSPHGERQKYSNTKQE